MPKSVLHQLGRRHVWHQGLAHALRQAALPFPVTLQTWQLARVGGGTLFGIFGFNRNQREAT